MSERLAEVADELYALPPAEFTAARNARAKEARAAGDADLAEAIRRLGKPTVAAWVVNMLVRHHPDEVARLLDLGVALREAQSGLDAAELKELNRQRHGVVAALTGQGRSLAKQLGHPVSETVAQEVERTLRAGMADPGAAVAVRGGRLTSALQSTGLGAFGSAAAAPQRSAERRSPDRTGDEPARSDKHARARQQAQADAEESQRAAAAADAELAQVQHQLDTTESDRQATTAELDDLRKQVRRLEERLAAHEGEARRAERERDAAARRAAAALRAAQRARARLTELGG